MPTLLGLFAIGNRMRGCSRKWRASSGSSGACPFFFFLSFLLIVNKHGTPCCGLHSLVSRALDILLDAFPVHLWTDYLSVALSL